MIDHEASHKLAVPQTLAAAPSHSTSRRVEQLGDRIQRELGPELAQVEKLLAEATRSKFAEVDALSRRATSMGGKRLRPVLLLLSAKVCNNGNASNAPRDLHAAAAAVELVHAASLVHDDLMDHAAERRHQPTIAHQFGDSAAVLLGDFLFTRAYAMAASCRSTLVARQIAVAATELCEGELRQQFSAANWDLDAKQYKSILLQKTAALCEVSCRLGTWRSRVNSQQRAALTGFGRSLGLAFQIFDDWLDYWGDAQVGKTLGTDLAQFKPTLPLIRLLAQASPARKAAITAALSRGDAVALDDVRSELERSDACEFTLQIAKRCAEHAKTKLECFSDSSAKECLMAVADYSVQRVN
jgi:octaprenyl-diphosphate synthase